MILFDGDGLLDELAIGAARERERSGWANARAARRAGPSGIGSERSLAQPQPDGCGSDCPVPCNRSRPAVCQVIGGQLASDRGWAASVAPGTRGVSSPF